MFDRLLGQPVVTSAAVRLTAGRLRVIGMHGVRNLDAFEQQLRVIRDGYSPVTMRDVVASLDGSRPLPPRSVWVTFDDGEHSAVVVAAEMIAAHGIPATMFVCPAFVEGSAFPWWEVVSAAVADGVPVRIGDRTYRDASAVSALKEVSDEQRREIVAALPVSDAVGNAPRATLEDLRRWRDLGHDVGNHTWDHPCLDRCEPAEQRRQIDEAAAWLDRHDLWDVRGFAYPNGNWSPASQAHLAEGHAVGLLFDHHVASRHPDRFAISRLKLDAGRSVERTRAIASGVHSGLFGVRRRIPKRLLPALPVASHPVGS